MYTIVLLHGVMSSRTEFRGNQRDLEDLGWPVVPMDLPGHGSRRVVAGSADSLDRMARDVAARLDERSAHLVVGHSLGALVALRLALLCPGLVSGVVLEDPPSLASNDPARVADEVERAVRRARADPDGEVTNLLAGSSTWTRSVAQDAVRNRALVDASSIAGFLRTSKWDLPALVAECPTSVQLIAATEPGTALKGTDREQLITLIRPDRVRVLRSGHTIHRDRPALWLITVLTFAKSLAQSHTKEASDRSKKQGSG